MSQKHQGSNGPTVEERLACLEAMFVRFAQGDATNTILGGGFGAVSDHLETVAAQLTSINSQLGPLRNLATTEPDFKPEQKARVDYLIKAWTPPEWKGLTALSADDKAVQYIGQVAPSAAEDDSQAVQQRSAAS